MKLITITKGTRDPLELLEQYSVNPLKVSGKFNWINNNSQINQISLGIETHEDREEVFLKGNLCYTPDEDTFIIELHFMESGGEKITEGKITFKDINFDIDNTVFIVKKLLYNPSENVLIECGKQGGDIDTQPGHKKGNILVGG